MADWAASHAPQLAERARGKEEFEIFEICVEYVQQEVERSQELSMRLRAGAYQIGTETESVIKVYEVELRDA